LAQIASAICAASCSKGPFGYPGGKATSFTQRLLKRFLLRFKEKGGKEKELPVHQKLEELLDQSEHVL